MKVPERVALRERIARVLAWQELSQENRDELLAEASSIVDELENGYRDSNTIGWMLLDPEHSDAEDAEA